HNVERGAGQRADRIEAEIAPQLEPDLAADVPQNGRLETPRLKQSGDVFATGREAAVRLAQCELVAVNVPHHAGFDDLGGRVDDAAETPFGDERQPFPV